MDGPNLYARREELSSDVLSAVEIDTKRVLPFTRDELIHGMEWFAHPNNPLIEPRITDFNYLADPTWLPPDLTPDNRFHLIAPAGPNLQQFISSDGVDWQRDRAPLIKFAIRPFLYKEGDTYHLFYTKLHKFVPYTDILESSIGIMSSRDLVHWGEPRTILTPTHPLQKKAVGNPSVLKSSNWYLLYSSGGTAMLTDCHFTEPHSIWVAVAKNIDGPYRLIQEPVIGPTRIDPHMNIGAGSIKVYRTTDGYFVGFNNGIHTDSKGGSTSAIKILWSVDGYEWEGFGNKHIVKPDSDKGEIFAYACDVHVYAGNLYLYYNTRDGRLRGTERICLTIGSLPK